MKILSKNKSGFTLIELLVVIAIIGILSSVVLASLNTARGKGADAAVKENMHGVRSQAEVFYDNMGSYTGVCSDANITTGLASASTTGGNPTTCNDSANEWAATATLKGAGGFWCIDSTGRAAPIASDIGTDTVCP